MKVSKRFWYYIVVIAFPLFFILHGVNEQFGLVKGPTVLRLFLQYLYVAIIVAALSKFLMKSYERATLFTFLVLCVYFFFGAVKDAIKSTFLYDILGSYKILLSIVVVLIILLTVAIRKIESPLIRASRFIKFLLIICLTIEVAVFFYSSFSGRKEQNHIGDSHHRLIEKISVPDTVQKPTIVWIVMDEYSGSTGLKEKWNYDNPLNNVLREKGFFVSDSAWSPYNYTHYSLVSTLDMMYLPGFKNHSVIGFRDIVRGNVSLQETNVVKLLESVGYDIYNYTIYDIKNHPTNAHKHFVDADFRLIDNQTLSGRIKQDIGWNFTNIFSGNKKEADSASLAQSIAGEAEYRQNLIDKSITVTRQAAERNRPAFLMFHYMLTHEPFIYRPDGTLDLSVGFGMYPDRYIPSVERANQALLRLIDAIQAAFKETNLVIIIQGDHGYKFDEADPLFEREGCSIFYAVYCSDLQYPHWKNPFNSTNTFRVLFNKYFHTNLPVLENHSFNLFYR